MGMIEDAIQSLELASRSARQRFEAASVLGRLQADRGDRAAALEWFEQAAEAPAPTVDAGRALLYDLASVLEDLGDVGRALAGVRVSSRPTRAASATSPARIERLSRARVRG